MFEGWRCELQAISFDGMSRPEIFEAVADASRLRAALDAYEARGAAAIEALGDKGAPASTVLRSAGRLSQREADKRARRAETLTQLPEAARALSEGGSTPNTSRRSVGRWRPPLPRPSPGPT